MVRVYRDRLYPTKGQETVLRQTLGVARELYNCALEERIGAYCKLGKSFSCYAQNAQLPETKALRPEFASVHSQVLQDVLKRLDLAFRAFFRRVKAGEKPGFPRFKGHAWYRTFVYPRADKTGAKLVAAGKRARLSGIGNVKVELHRPMEGRVKQASVTRAGDGHWYISFCCDEVAPKPLGATGKSVGIDVGITTFAALRDGSMVPHPRVFENAQAKLAVAQRNLAKCKRGSNRRRKRERRVAAQHGAKDGL